MFNQASTPCVTTACLVAGQWIMENKTPHPAAGAGGLLRRTIESSIIFKHGVDFPLNMAFNIPTPPKRAADGDEGYGTGQRNGRCAGGGAILPIA